MSQLSAEKRASIETQRADVHAQFMAFDARVGDLTSAQEVERLRLRQKMMDYDMALNPPAFAREG